MAIVITTHDESGNAGAVDKWRAVDQAGRSFWAATEAEAFGMADDYNRRRPVGWSARKAAAEAQHADD